MALGQSWPEHCCMAPPGEMEIYNTLPQALKATQPAGCPVGFTQISECYEFKNTAALQPEQDSVLKLSY
eukprot:1508315-Rhodomonas_salina.1